MRAGAAWQRVCDTRAHRSPDLVVEAASGGIRDRIVVRNELDGSHVRVATALWTLVERFDGRVAIAIHLADENRARQARAQAPIRTPEALDGLARGILALERAGLVDCRLAGVSRERSARERAHSVRQRRGRWANPLSLRLPMHDPDRWLDRLQPLLERLPSRRLGIGGAALFALAICVAIASGDRLWRDVASLVATPQSWWWLLIVWPLMKGLHELAHALATRRFGGRVHEVGVALLVLMPVPYVDASDAWLFPRRRDRMLVSAAGMLAEGALAAIALLLWSVLESGGLRDAALAIVLTGTVTTLLFNANPLLRFDGYYLLQDALDMPNLAARSAAWWRRSARRWLFGVIEPDDALPMRERGWLAGYGAASLAYRYVVMVAIAWWLLQSVPLLGVPLAGYALWPMLVQPLVRLSRWVIGCDELSGRRVSASAPTAALVLSLVLVIALVPVSASSRVTGVVRAADSTAVIAPDAGELVALPDMRRVRAGDLVATLQGPALLDEAARLAARLDGLDAAIGEAFSHDALERRLLRGEHRTVSERLRSLQARIAALEVRADVDGRFVPASADLMPGQHVARGTLLGHLVGDSALAVYAVMQEHQFAQTVRGMGRASVRLAEAPRQVHPAGAIREAPSAGHHLPSAVLAGEGGGGIAVAGEPDQLKTVRPVFDVRVDLPTGVRVAGLGGRAYVTFHHPAETLARRWWRGLRRLFLERLAI